MSRHPPQSPAGTSAPSSTTQPAYIPQLPLGAPAADFLAGPQSPSLPPPQPHPQQSQHPSPPNPRKRKASDSASMTGMPSPSISGYRPPPAAYASQPQQGEQPADTQAAQGVTPKKSRTNTPWSPAEEQRLKTMRDAGNSWSEIAKTFPNRTEGSVKKHWYKDMHYADFAEDESAALLAAIKEYEASKWKVIGAKVGKPAKVKKTSPLSFEAWCIRARR
ncbi:MAG: hypothetical protein LQ345_004359 [Seirophora villosa]|nr:MAG: hypothetical protein LQ345_004359 [Seirophora villosa]